MKTLQYTLLSSIALGVLLLIAGNCNRPTGRLVEREDHGFRAVFPGPVAEKKESIEAGETKTDVIHFLHVRWDEQYELSINSLPGASTASGSEAAMRTTMEHMIQRYRGQLERKQTVRSSGIEGSDITVRTGGGGLIRTRLFEKDGKLYIATARVRGGEEMEARAHRFIDSMELL